MGFWMARDFGVPQPWILGGVALQRCDALENFITNVSPSHPFSAASRPPIPLASIEGIA
jgi:hypothetical protein